MHPKKKVIFVSKELCRVGAREGERVGGRGTTLRVELSVLWVCLVRWEGREGIEDEEEGKRVQRMVSFGMGRVG